VIATTGFIALPSEEKYNFSGAGQRHFEKPIPGNRTNRVKSPKGIAVVARKAITAAILRIETIQAK